jgi:hypothetical protein
MSVSADNVVLQNCIDLLQPEKEKLSLTIPPQKLLPYINGTTQCQQKAARESDTLPDQQTCVPVVCCRAVHCFLSHCTALVTHIAR